MRSATRMSLTRRTAVTLAASLCLVGPAAASSASAQATGDAQSLTSPVPVRAAGVPLTTPSTPADVSLYRVFLHDGSAVVSYGEFARVGDEIVVSMPLGTDLKNPRLQLITLKTDAVDWARTNQYSLSVRYQHYAATRGEADFAALTSEVSAILNQIAFSTEPKQALELADQARQTLAAWPARHYGYRAADIQDIVALIDEATSRIVGPGAGVQLSFVAIAAPPVTEPVLGQPTIRDQVRRLVTLAGAATRPVEKVALLRSAILLMDDPASGITRDESADLRRSLEEQIGQEVAIDDSYNRMTSRLVGLAHRAASQARVVDVERVLDSVATEDLRLGAKRPDTVRALRAELEARLDAARELRLRRDQWTMRRGVYRSYVDSISAQVAQLVKVTSSLEAIRKLAGPSPRRLTTLQRTLRGGIERLQAVVAPEGLRATHDILIAAWRFAESAADTRQRAVISGDLPTAWQASSAAAGALLFLERAQREMRAALQPPQLN